jgi:hypothetical protein
MLRRCSDIDGHFNCKLWNVGNKFITTARNELLHTGCILLYTMFTLLLKRCHLQVLQLFLSVLLRFIADIGVLQCSFVSAGDCPSAYLQRYDTIARILALMAVGSTRILIMRSRALSRIAIENLARVLFRLLRSIRVVKICLVASGLTIARHGL